MGVLDFNEPCVSAQISVAVGGNRVSKHCAKSDHQDFSKGDMQAYAVKRAFPAIQLQTVGGVIQVAPTLTLDVWTLIPTKVELVIMKEYISMTDRKSRFEMTPEKFQRFLREGRGQGAGATYRPWIQIDDLSSKGRSRRTACALTGFRTHHLLSDNEFYAFLDVWWDEDVEDIREQYPLLPVEETIAIADALGVKHPREKKFYIPQTSDLFIVKKNWVGVVAVKEDEDADEKRTKEKLSIAEEFWCKRGIPTRLALESTLKTQRLYNVDWIYKARRVRQERPYCPGDSRLFDHIVNRAATGPLLSCELASRTDEELRLPSGTSLAAIRRLLSERVLVTDVAKGAISRGCEVSVGGKWL